MSEYFDHRARHKKLLMPGLKYTMLKDEGGKHINYYDCRLVACRAHAGVGGSLDWCFGVNVGAFRGRHDRAVGVLVAKSARQGEQAARTSLLWRMLPCLARVDSS